MWYSAAYIKCFASSRAGLGAKQNWEEGLEISNISLIFTYISLFKVNIFSLKAEKAAMNNNVLVSLGEINYQLLKANAKHLRDGKCICILLGNCQTTCTPPMTKESFCPRQTLPAFGVPSVLDFGYSNRQWCLIVLIDGFWERKSGWVLWLTDFPSMFSLGILPCHSGWPGKLYVTRLALNLQTSNCFCFLGTGIKGTSYRGHLIMSFKEQNFQIFINLKLLWNFCWNYRVNTFRTQGWMYRPFETWMFYKLRIMKTKYFLNMYFSFHSQHDNHEEKWLYTWNEHAYSYNNLKQMSF